MIITMDTLLTVKENDRVTGRRTWDHKVSLNDLIASGWDDINENMLLELEEGNTIKLYSPNGRRVLFITK